MTFLLAPDLGAQDATARLEPDHVYVWVSRGAPEGSVLRELGITQYPDTVRPGEGVEWIVFAFENIYLELLWVADEGKSVRTGARPGHRPLGWHFTGSIRESAACRHRSR